MTEISEEWQDRASYEAEIARIKNENKILCDALEEIKEKTTGQMGTRSRIHYIAKLALEKTRIKDELYWNLTI